MNFLSKNSIESLVDITLKEIQIDQNGLGILIFDKNEKLIACGRISNKHSNELKEFYVFHDILVNLKLEHNYAVSYFFANEDSVSICFHNTHIPYFQKYFDIKHLVEALKQLYPDIIPAQERQIKELREKYHLLNTQFDNLKSELENKEILLIELNKKTIELERLREYKKEKDKLELLMKTDYVRNSVHVSSLSVLLTVAQYNRINELPYIEQNEIKAMLRPIPWLYIGGSHANFTIREICISEIEYPEGARKIRVKIGYWESYEGDNEVPPYNLPCDETRYFLISSDGKIDKVDYNADSKEKYKLIKYTEVK